MAMAGTGTGTGTNSGTGGGGARTFTPTDDQKKKIAEVHQKLGSLDAINDQMVKLKQELANTPFDNKDTREKLEKDINKLQKDYKALYQAALTRAKEIAQGGNDLMGHMMAVLAANMTMYRKGARTGALDYLNPFADPRKTWQIRTNQQKIDAEESLERRKERAKTPAGMAIRGVGEVISATGGVVGQGLRYAGQGFDAAGNAAMDFGARQRAQALEDRDLSRSGLSRAAQYALGVASSAVGTVSYAAGAAPKIAASASETAGSAVNATGHYLTGENEHLIGETYTGALTNLADGFVREVEQHCDNIKLPKSSISKTSQKEEAEFDYVHDTSRDAMHEKPKDDENADFGVASGDVQPDDEERPAVAAGG